MKKQVLGVKIDDVSMPEALAIVESWFGKTGKHYIVTPNPEFLVEAQKNQEFRAHLNNADLAIPDGVGLKIAGVKNRVTGIDLMNELIQFATVRGLSVGLLGGQKNVAVETAECLKKAHPDLKISFAEAGPIITSDPSESPLVIPSTDILFVAFGAPKQEKWIAENLNKLPVKVAMGVGGSFDYISGRVPRAPVWLRKLGLEWLYRLIVQPWRIKRQIKLILYLILLVKGDSGLFGS